MLQTEEKLRRFYMLIGEKSLEQLEEIARKRRTSKAEIIRRLVRRELRSCLKKSGVQK